MQISRLFSLLFSALILLHSVSSKAQNDPAVISGIVLLQERKVPDFRSLSNLVKNNWKLKVDSSSFSEKTWVFSTHTGATVMLAYLDYPVAPADIGAAARLSWLWKTAETECSGHKAQLVVSVMGNGSKSLELHKIFTQTAAAILESTKGPGIYMESQYLLISNGYYLSAAKNMLQNQILPLYCWVYFGRPGGGKGFTFGLSEFGLMEMEIVQEQEQESQVHATLYDAAMTVVKYGSRLKDGQALTTEEGVSLKTKFSPGVFIQDKQVIQLSY